ncbi:tetratricopeptide repeat protein [Marinobacterium sp. YM272]|uniref:tetratricopeptide repeat protein n=1 Tax=Marinobacterium sp. YM272 TaxID=3421654 RepID=UPI003D7FE15C
MVPSDDKIKKDEINVAALNSIQAYRNREPLPPFIQTLWGCGDWPSLVSISLEQAEQLESKAWVAAIIAVAHYQNGTEEKAQAYIKKALEWGMENRVVAQLLTSGAYNSLGRAALLMGNLKAAYGHFQQSVKIGAPEIGVQLTTPIRANHQSSQIGLAVEIPNFFAESLELPLLVDSSKSFTEQLMTILDSFAKRLVIYGQDLVIDGVEVFKEKDPFLVGKVALGLAYWVTEYPAGSEITKLRCMNFRDIICDLKGFEIDSWGIFFYLKALCLLNEKGVLKDCFSYEYLNSLKGILDWRSFVNEVDYTLIGKPNNFYGIAYRIAYARYQLNWDSVIHSECLLKKELDHYETASGGEGLADETNGKGRYDRYSFLLIAEIAYSFYEAGLPLTKKMKTWLKTSVDYVLFNVNSRGDGFQWGRSIGAYGDSAFLEILTAAAVHNLLNDEEMRVARYFAERITAKFLDFWYQPGRGSINLWSDGRATESYRGKNRVLGENLSLIHQHIYCQSYWKSYGDVKKEAELSASVTTWLSKQPSGKLWKARHKEACFGIASIRVGGRLINIPFVNGDRYWKKAAYQPAPYIRGFVQAVPDFDSFLFSPVLDLEGKERRAIYPCYDDIKISENHRRVTLLSKISYMSSLNGSVPTRDKSISGTFEYTVSSRIIKIKYEIKTTSENITPSSFYLPIMLPGKKYRESDKYILSDTKDGRKIKTKIFNKSASEINISLSKDDLRVVENHGEVFNIFSIIGKFVDCFSIEIILYLGRNDI